MVGMQQPQGQIVVVVEVVVVHVWCLGGLIRCSCPCHHQGASMDLQHLQVHAVRDHREALLFLLPSLPLLSLTVVAHL